MKPEGARGLLKCIDCGLPRVIYSKYKLGGNAARNLSRSLSQMKFKHEFHCGTDMSEFINNEDLKTKVVTAEKRLTCNHRVKWQYYHAHESIGNESNPIGICSFCGCELNTSDTEELKKLIKDGSRVSPSCGKPHCLRMNPKANFKDGWTVKKKQDRKRNASANKPNARAKRRKKPKPKTKKPKKT